MAHFLLLFRQLLTLNLATVKELRLGWWHTILWGRVLLRHYKGITTRRCCNNTYDFASKVLLQYNYAIINPITFITFLTSQSSDN